MKGVVLLMYVLPLAACASIGEGTIESSQRILITSEPSNARVQQRDRLICTTPCRAERRTFRPGEGFQFVFPSGETVDVPVEYRASGNVIGNVIAGGVVGAVVDAATGRVQMREDHVHAELETRLNDELLD